jgi:hypothetical protein
VRAPDLVSPGQRAWRRARASIEHQLVLVPEVPPSLPVALTVVDGQIRHRDPAVDS